MFKDLDELKKKYTNIRRFNEDQFINLQPIQRGGVLTPEAQKALMEWGDGYSLCDNCLKGDISLIENPPVKDFMVDFRKFLRVDDVLFTESCRRSKQIAMAVLKEKFHDTNRNIILLDSNAHYSTFLAAEWNGLDVREVPKTGYPEFKVELEKYSEKIDEIEDETGDLPLAALLTHVDYAYGNYNDASIVSKICQKKGVPFILNGAYTVGTLNINTNEIGADFITGSGHKSMSSSGPMGILGFKKDYETIIKKRSNLKGDLTGKTFGIKMCYMLGCPGVYGAPLMTLMASFPSLVERTQPDKAKEEGEKAEYFIQKAEKVEGIKMLGTRPKIYPLINLETPGFKKISETHPRKGFFLREDFKKEGIIGMAPGISKKLEISTYGLTWEQVYYVTDTFLKIARKNGMKIEN
ncbi:MAG: O-phospho-L-seryl-tRNA:Cys-tRNA synthase [archaeon]|nr:O-phospho-L-seryl-tRNA:Cys-tRNA synthase [archaeon]